MCIEAISTIIGFSCTEAFLPNPRPYWHFMSIQGKWVPGSYDIERSSISKLGKYAQSKLMKIEMLVHMAPFGHLPSK